LRKRHLQSVSILYIKGRYGYVLFSDACPNAGQHILQQPERNKTPSMDEEISSRSRKAVALNLTFLSSATAYEMLPQKRAIKKCA
jgi:hypothetical protein